MKHARRLYHSELRDEQAEQTRERILDALVQRLAKGGIAELSIPAVAREAGVSVPTVYRYFRTKRALVEALGGHFVKRTGLLGSQDPPPRVTNIDELAALVRGEVMRVAALSPQLRAVMATDVGKRMRRSVSIPKRLAVFEAGLGAGVGRLPAAEQRMLLQLMVVLFSSGTLRTFEDYFGIGAEEAANHLDFAIRFVARALEREGRREGK